MMLLRIILFLVGVIGMSIFGYFGLSSILAGIITLVGLILGFLFRNQIAEGIEYYSRAVTIGLFIYGIVLFLGDRFGIENNTKLVIITLTTVVIFDLQFWSLSDPNVVNIEQSIQE